MKNIKVYCTSCGRELWQMLTNEEKIVAINDGQAEGLECSDCIVASLHEQAFDDPEEEAFTKTGDN